MNGSVRYDFEWDPGKAAQNQRKHRVSFEQAATVFLDQQALSVYDSEHSENEDRWITLGSDKQGALLVVCHTFREIGASNAVVRLISSRKATKAERKQYERHRS
jgi:uncharacterized protein